MDSQGPAQRCWEDPGPGIFRNSLSAAGFEEAGCPSFPSLVWCRLCSGRRCNTPLLSASRRPFSASAHRQWVQRRLDRSVLKKNQPPSVLRAQQLPGDSDTPQPSAMFWLWTECHTHIRHFLKGHLKSSVGLCEAGVVTATWKDGDRTNRVWGLALSTELGKGRGRAGCGPSILDSAPPASLQNSHRNSALKILTVHLRSFLPTSYTPHPPSFSSYFQLNLQIPSTLKIPKPKPQRTLQVPRGTMGRDTSLLHLPRTPASCIFQVQDSRISVQKQNGFLFSFFFSTLRQCGSNIYQQRQRKGLFFFSFFKEVNFISRTCVFLISNAVF